jgi:hypothetical protein
MAFVARCLVVCWLGSGESDSFVIHRYLFSYGRRRLHTEENRMSSNLVRLSGLAAMLGGVLGIVLTPILTHLWATYSDTYLYYGRAYFLVYLGCLLGLTGLYAPRRGSGLQGENWGFGLTFVGLSIGLVGDVVAYWGGPPGQDFTQLQATGFSIELIGLLAVLIGSVVLGVTYLQANVFPKVVPGLLIAAGPGGLLLSSLHAPSGTLLLVCCAWVVLGYLLLTAKVAPVERRPRVAG